jgi:hypothetical protein
MKATLPSRVPIAAPSCRDHHFWVIIRHDKSLRTRREAKDAVEHAVFVGAPAKAVAS